jgi:hypothetical protein
LLRHIDNVITIILLCLVASVGSPLHNVVISVVVTLLHHIFGFVIGGGGGAIGLSCCWCYY